MLFKQCPEFFGGLGEPLLSGDVVAHVTPFRMLLNESFFDALTYIA
jgi:hypothetical protein